MDEWIRQAEVWVGQAESWIRQQPPEQIYVAAAVIAVTILVLIAGVVPNLKFLEITLHCVYSVQESLDVRFQLVKRTMTPKNIWKAALKRNGCFS